MHGRIIIHGALPAVTNMAVDEVLARQCDEGHEGFPVIRFYWWEVPTLSLGAKERIDEAADADACRDLGIDLVRRPTGGRSVLHHKELTYAIVAPAGEPPFSTSVEESYRQIAEAQARGLADIGVELQLTPGGRRLKPQTGTRHDSADARHHLPCFAAPSRYELTWNGRKVIGSAQRRLRNAVLQHGSILQRGDWQRLARATGCEAAELEETVIGIEDILDGPVERDRIISAMLPHLKSIFPVEFTRQDLTGAEWQRVRTLEPEVAGRLQR